MKYVNQRKYSIDMGKSIRRLALTMAVLLLWNGAVPGMVSVAADRTLTLSQAVSYARQANTDRKQKNLEITLKELELKQAMESVRAIRKDKATIRYSLLFNIKFPENLNLTEEEELTLKAPDIELEIRSLNREIQDIQLQSESDTATAFIEAYALQEEIRTSQAQYDQLKQEVQVMTAKVRTGKVKKEDLQSLMNDETNLKNSLAGNKQKYEASKGKLSRLMGMDVSSGYLLSNPLNTYMVPRSQLETAVNYTLERDYSVYMKKSIFDAAQGKVNLIHGLFKSKFGSKYAPLEGYVNAEDLDYSYYMRLYEDMLKKLDAPWDPVIRLFFLFFVLEIPFEWFKGELSGTRYIKEEKYALPTAMVARDNARTAFRSQQKAAADNVRSSYDMMAAAYRAYNEMVKTAAAEKGYYEKVLALNRMGKSSLSEVSTQKEVFLQAQQAENDALAEFNNVTTAFNRLTCGFVTASRSGDLSTLTAASGESTAEESYDDSMYYIQDLVPGVTKTFGIRLNSLIKAEEYELWFDTGKQIGGRTPVSEKILHISSAFGSTSSMLVKLYNKEILVKSGTIDPSKTSGRIRFYETKEEASTASTELINVGTYRLIRQEDDIMTQLELTLRPELGIGYYTVTDGSGRYLVSSEKTEIAQRFLYISFAALNTKDLKVQLYDRSQKYLGEASLGTAGSAILMKPVGQGEGGSL